MKNFSQIVEFKEEKFGLFKAENKEGDWYAFLSSISAYFIEDNGREYVTRYLDKNKELIGEVDNVVKLLNIWNIGEHFTASQICTLIHDCNQYYINKTIGFARNYDNGRRNYLMYRTKDVFVDCFKDFVTIVDDNIEEINVDISDIEYNIDEEGNIYKIFFLMYANDNNSLCYEDTYTYRTGFIHLNDNEFKTIKGWINHGVKNFIRDLKNIFGEDVHIVFYEPRKFFPVDSEDEDDDDYKYLSKIEDLVFENIRNNYDVIERKKYEEDEDEEE